MIVVVCKIKLFFLSLAVPGGKKYAVLQSLDLICDSPEEHRLWYDTVCKYNLLVVC